jgi:AcrR family transcriptional regulator
MAIPVKTTADKTSEPVGSTKLRILAAAQEVFAEKGFDGASTREIAAKAGVNISSLHYHWDSKETLYRAIFERIYQQLGEILSGVIEGPRVPGGGRETVRRSISVIFDFYVQNPTIPRLLMRRIMDSDDTDEARERDVLGQAWQTFAAWVRQFNGDRLPERDVNFFMLTVQCVLLVLMLDSPHVSAMLDGNVKDEVVRERLREQVTRLVEKLIGLD